jgi:uncharacterized protein YfbU (UPF0304 family)
MRLYEVGPKPTVSPRGVNFDNTKPDRYIFLSPAIELMETLDFDNTEASQNIHEVVKGGYRGIELEDKIKEYCPDIEVLIDDVEIKTQKLIDELKERVENNSNISYDEKRAWLGNIDTMRDYYLQYVANETVYKCLLKSMADRFVKSHIETITFPLRKNYGLVLQDLSYILREHRPPFDAEITVEKGDNGLFGKFAKISN